MSLKAAFAEVDISPEYFPVRTYFSSASEVMDPLFAHAVIFDDGLIKLAVLSLDVVIVEAEYAEKIRHKFSTLSGIPESNIMVCATHNHACSAVVDRPGSSKDDIYIDFMIEKSVEVLTKALDKLQLVEIGVNSGFEERISFNRRYIKKNGTVISQPSIEFFDDEILCHEGIVDPGVGVMSFKNMEGKIVGIIVNFACHAVHHMGDLSAGYPGVLCDRIKEKYGEDTVCLFMNGACGNVIHHNYSDPNQEDTKEITGSLLAESVAGLVDSMTYESEASLACKEEIVSIKYRDISGLEENIDNLEEYNVFKALITKGWYKYSLEKLKKMHADRDHEKAVIQAMRIGKAVIGTAPCEYFAENALKIKEQSPVTETFIVSLANGWLGYIPHPAAFQRRGGHESTWAVWSKMEPAAGDIIADKILELIEEVK